MSCLSDNLFGLIRDLSSDLALSSTQFGLFHVFSWKGRDKRQKTKRDIIERKSLSYRIGLSFPRI